MEKDDNLRENEQIFKHLTFDGQGNPLTVTEPDLDKINPSHV